MFFQGWRFFAGTSGTAWCFRSMAIEFYFTPELHLKDGRIIRDLDDAVSFAREQEVRPGVDQRDEVLHRIEAVLGHAVDQAPLLRNHLFGPCNMPDRLDKMVMLGCH